MVFIICADTKAGTCMRFHSCQFFFMHHRSIIRGSHLVLYLHPGHDLYLSGITRDILIPEIQLVRLLVFTVKAEPPQLSQKPHNAFSQRNHWGFWCVRSFPRNAKFPETPAFALQTQSISLKLPGWTYSNRYCQLVDSVVQPACYISSHHVFPPRISRLLSILIFETISQFINKEYINVNFK